MMGLLIGLLFCHYLGDFTHLSRPYILKAKSIGYPLLPIFYHAHVHGFLAWILIWAVKDFTSGAIACYIIVPTHCGIDVLKGRLNVWYPKLANPENPCHWYVFGADQLLHIVVLILLAWLI